VNLSVSDVLDKSLALISKQKQRIDEQGLLINQINFEIEKCQEDIKKFMGALGKQYEDMLHFKDQTTELITNFKYEIVFEQQNVMQNLDDLKSAKNYTNY
jgi:hypothetical protein